MSNVGLNNLTTREAWLSKVLSNIPEGSKILDAGAGELQYKKLCTHLDYTSQDFGKYDGKGNKCGLQRDKWDQSQVDVLCDITTLPWVDNTFDAVMCIEVLEHLPTPVFAIDELTRVLKAGSILILTAPVCSLTHFAPFYFQTGYSRYFYEYWCEKFGLEIIELTHNGNFFEYLGQELRRIPKIAEMYTTDKLTKVEETILKTEMLPMLERLSKLDKGSNELLSFGIQVVARKKTDNIRMEAKKTGEIDE